MTVIEPVVATPVYMTTISGRPSDWPAEGVMHFRLSEPTLGALDLTCDTGYVVRSYEFGFPEVREAVYLNSLHDGTFDLSRYIGARAVSLDIALRPTDSPGGISDVRIEPRMRDALLAYTHPWCRPNLLFSEHGDDRVRFISLRGADAPYAISKPRFNDLSVSWRAPRGLIQSLDTMYADISFREELDEAYDITFTNPGNAPANWTAEIEGELANPRFMLDHDPDQQLWLNFEVTPGTGPVLIDSYTRTVQIGGQLTGFRYVDDFSTWFTIPPGDHVITMTHASTPRLGYPFATWQPDAAPNNAVWAASTTPIDATTRLTPPARLIANPTPPPTQVANWANLAAVKADTTYGDGRYTFGTFQLGEYIVLADQSHAWYDTSVGQWAAGERPTGNNPPPGGAPPWAWSTTGDSGGGGEPPQSHVLFYLHPNWI